MRSGALAGVGEDAAQWLMVLSVDITTPFDQKVHVLQAVNVFPLSASCRNWIRNSGPLISYFCLGRFPPIRGKRRGIKAASKLGEGLNPVSGATDATEKSPI